MAVLTMDTSTQALAVGLGDGEQVLASAVSFIPRAHSRLLQPMLQQLLEAAGMTARDLTEIAVGVGPGSYTGVRLAVATVKAMALALNIPVIPISTLAALAEAACPGETLQSTYVMPLVYARRERAFGAIYKKTGVQWTCIDEAQVLQVADWMERLHEYRVNAPETDSVVVHDFSGRSDATAAKSLEDGRTFVNAVLPLASVAGNLGAAMQRIATRQDFGCTPRNGEDIHALVPEYALRVEAEVKQSERGTVDGTS